MSEKKPHWLKPRWLHDGDCVICQRCRKAYDISTNADRSIPTVCPFCGSEMDMEEVQKV